MITQGIALKMFEPSFSVVFFRASDKCILVDHVEGQFISTGDLLMAMKTLRIPRNHITFLCQISPVLDHIAAKI